MNSMLDSPKMGLPAFNLSPLVITRTSADDSNVMKITKVGILHRLSEKSGTKWKEYTVLLSGSQLLLFVSSIERSLPWLIVL